MRVAAMFLLLAPLAAIAAAPDSWGTPAISDLFGVEIHFAAAGAPENIRHIKELGARWVRMDTFWSRIETTKGVYDFSHYDALVDEAEKAGIGVVLILDYGNNLYQSEEQKGRPPASEPALAAFGRFCAEAARHFAGRHVVWELWNEPNLDQFWPPKADVAQYIAVADAGTAAIRAAVPEARIVGPALAGPLIDPGNEPKIEAFFTQVMQSKAAHRWDAVTVHPYRFKGAVPETAMPQLDVIRTIMRSAGIDPGQVPVIAGEWGYSTVRQGVPEDLQAAYAVRELLVAAIERMPYTIWYDWEDDGGEPDNNEHHFGLIRRGAWRAADLSDGKPAFRALGQTIRLLNGFVFDALLPAGDTVMAARFKGGAGYAFVLWSKDNRDTEVDLPLPAGRWRIQPILGEAAAVGSGHLTARAMPAVLVPAE